MNVNLGERLDKFVGDLVKSGMYQSQSEVVREGLRLLKDRESLRKMHLQELRKELQIGLDQLDRGESVPWDPEEIKREGRRLLAKRKKASA
jgi:antitoxin ParD1/3/4